MAGIQRSQDHGIVHAVTFHPLRSPRYPAARTRAHEASLADFEVGVWGVNQKPE
jgi:hypothetical protein